MNWSFSIDPESQVKVVGDQAKVTASIYRDGKFWAAREIAIPVATLMAASADVEDEIVRKKIEDGVIAVIKKEGEIEMHVKSRFAAFGSPQEIPAGNLA